VPSTSHLLVFTLDDQHYALQLAAVERTARMVEITPLPQAPVVVRGVITVHGRIIPVLDIRQRFHLPPRETLLSDQLLIARTKRRTVALIADSVVGVLEQAPQDMVDAGMILPGIDYLSGVVKLADGLIFIHDLDTFLSLEEELQLDTATSR
jgi:purine-binding chemotaxis protein CheW